MGHNQSNTRRLNEVSADEEIRLFVTRYRRSNARRAFVRLAGWVLDCRRHGNTLDNLSAAGCEYVADWGANDDQPYLMTLDDGKTLVSVPYSYDINDKQPRAQKRLHPMEIYNLSRGRESGRVIHIALHPYLIGLPYRIDALDQALAYVCRHQGVWLTTGSEIARHYRTQI